MSKKNPKTTNKVFQLLQCRAVKLYWLQRTHTFTTPSGMSRCRLTQCS